MNLGPYAKAIVSGTIAVLVTVKSALDPDGAISVAEWLAIAGALLVAGGGVYALANTARAPYAKAITAAVATGLGVVATGLINGDLVSVTMIVNALLAVVNGLVVSQVPNAVRSDSGVG